MTKNAARLVSLLLLLATACSGAVTSQPITVSQVTPPAVCGAQIVSEVTVRGAGFTPLVLRAFTSTPGIELPRVLLRQRSAPDGSPRSGVEVTVPDDPTPPGDHTRWQSAEELRFDVYPGLAAGAGGGTDLPPGLYDVSVRNPDGRLATLEGSLAVVPAPTLANAMPSPLCSAQAEVSLDLTGTGFIRLDGELPRVRFTAQDEEGTSGEFAASEVSECMDLAAPQGVSLSSCKALVVRVPQGMLMPGSYRVAVTNPRATGCTSSEEVRVAVIPPPQVTNIMSATICTAQAESTVLIEGSGFLMLADGTGPSVKVDGMPFPSAASECADIPDGRGAKLCTTLTVRIPKDALPAVMMMSTRYPLVIENPGPAACKTTMMLELESVPPPTLSDVTPKVMCAGGGTLNLSGKDFRDGAAALVGGVSATRVTVAPSGESAVANFSGVLQPGGPYDLILRNPDGCQSILPRTVLITPGPSILFVDPPAIPNAVSIQVTVYGSGVTAPIKSVEIARAGTTTYTTLEKTLDPARPSRVLATIPAGLPEGSYDMRLSDQTECPAFLPGALKVVAMARLAEPTIEPAFGTTAQNTAVVVRGSGFVSTPRVYLNPTGNPPGSRAAALRAVTFLSGTSLTAVVPRGLTPGTYDLLVVNPDGNYGINTRQAFTVTAMDAPPPVVTDIAPSSVVTGVSTQVIIRGSGFRAGAQVALACRDGNGALVPGSAAGTPTVSPTSLTVNVTGVGLYCIVRVTNADRTFFDYSAIGVTNSSLNLTGFKSGPALTVPRRALGAAAGRATAVARFVYAVGGDNGSDAGARDTVEAALSGLDGTLDRFFVLSQKLPQARSFPGVTALGRFLYAVGGFNGTAAQRTVYRAQILDPLAAPQVDDVDVRYHSTTGLAGQYIYRVSAVLSGDASMEPSNPGGETLSGDFFPINLPAINGKLQVILLWSKVPSAASYRIYRSPKAGDPAGSELLLATVAASTVPLLYIDDGSVTPAGAAPLPLGSTGAWRSIAQLNTARIGPAVAAAQDPADATKWYLYAAGGNSGTVGSPAPLSSVEYLPITLSPNGSQSFGAWTPSTRALGRARWAAQGIAATSGNNSRIGAGTTLLFVSSGSGSSLTNTEERIDVATVQAGGELTAFASAGDAPRRPAHGALIVNNIFMAFGGFLAGAATNNSDSANLKAGGTTLDNFNSFGSGKLLMPRALQGTTMESAFIYQLGGASGAPGTAQATTEQTIW